MDTASPVNTQNTQESQNPQGTRSPGASDAEDFQSTAPSSTLNEDTENLTVQKTGDPVDGSTISRATDSLPMSWIVGIVLLVLVGGFVFYKLLKESIEETAPVAAYKRPAATKRTAAAKKSSVKKKSAAKKSSKKRR